ncbi:hypothetical protein P7K49_022688 [Saguinus oedipus]|uniref:Ion transport domain-containing protein n=1 Tax=Saguinus oedipus TaxID=9490 RepID=A0ABQ9ULU4_SAGOE|nr:hypothetical protein P7K49_022688 [Saguinus oedipus]
MSLFVLSSKDGWVNIMYDGLDAVGVDQQGAWRAGGRAPTASVPQPVQNHNPWMLLYFISFLLIVSFFVLNMFVGVVVENFHKCRQHQEAEEARRREEKRLRRLERRRRSKELPVAGRYLCAHRALQPRTLAIRRAPEPCPLPAWPPRMALHATRLAGPAWGPVRWRAGRRGRLGEPTTAGEEETPPTPSPVPKGQVHPRFLTPRGASTASGTQAEAEQRGLLAEHPRALGPQTVSLFFQALSPGQVPALPRMPQALLLQLLLGGGRAS